VLGDPGETDPPRLLFIVPAHDEEDHIEACARSLLRQHYPSSACRVTVIVDNCRDATAARARSAGAEVVERCDPVRRGKPHAIAWALDHIEWKTFDAVVIVDADSVVDEGFAAGLALEAPLRGRAVQAYFSSSNEFENWLTRLAGVFTRVRYELVYPHKQRVGLNVPLTGNGMCLGTDLLAGTGWQAFSLTEDLELYARWTAEGVPIRYARNALLQSQEARSLGQAASQRARWATGRWRVLREWAGPLLTSTHIRWRQKLDALLELGLPSPALQVVLSIAAATGATRIPPPAKWPLVVLALIPGLVHAKRAATVIGRHPQRVRTLVAFLMVPVYIAWRAGLALRTIMREREVEWRRTQRHQGTSRRHR